VLSKAYSIAQSVILLIRGGHPEEAFGLSRSIVECALNLRWITADDKQITRRSLKFMRYGFAVRNLWYSWIKKRYVGKNEELDADAYAKAWDLVNDPSGAYRHWSGERNFTRTVSELLHPLNRTSKDPDQLKIKMAQEYFHPSCFVHCSQPGLDNFFGESGIFTIHNLNPSKEDYGKSAIFICNTSLHEIILYSLFGMNVLVPTSFACLTQHQFVEEEDEYRFGPDPHP
jgi:hypothetical protein